MRVFVMPADNEGCGYYRVALPVIAARMVGADVDVRNALDIAHDGWMTTHGVAPLDCDVLVLQRPMRAVIVNAIPYWQAQGVAVVVEVDDDFTTLPPANQAYPLTDPRLFPHANRDHLRRAAAMADLVTVTTPALAERYGTHGQVAVVPNYVPRAYLTVASQRDRSVGWSGQTRTHIGDLESTHGAVARAIEGTDWTFRVVGQPAGVAKALGLPTEPPATGWLPLRDYPRAVAGLGIGIVPLCDSGFNRAKSCLKALEYAAFGVPSVIAPTPDNLRLHKDGAGLVARNPRQWRTHLRTLIDSPEARLELADKGRRAAVRHLIEDHVDEWLAAWRNAADNRAKRAA